MAAKVSCIDWWAKSLYITWPSQISVTTKTLHSTLWSLAPNSDYIIGYTIVCVNRRRMQNNLLEPRNFSRIFCSDGSSIVKWLTVVVPVVRRSRPCGITRHAGIVQNLGARVQALVYAVICRVGQRVLGVRIQQLTKVVDVVHRSLYSTPRTYWSDDVRLPQTVYCVRWNCSSVNMNLLETQWHFSIINIVQTSHTQLCILIRSFQVSINESIADKLVIKPNQITVVAKDNLLIYYGES